jgi:transcriptional regulator with XRE-family HTH domain
MEKIENIQKNIKENLIRYRKGAGLTQAQLASKLGYSDKTISKWEREEGVPDIYILYQIAELYGVTVNDLLAPPVSIVKKIKEKAKVSLRNRIIIYLLTAVSIFSIATILYVILDIANIIYTLSNIYIFAIPLSCLTLIIMNSIWKENKYLNLLLISAFIWTFTLSIYVALSIDHLGKIFLIPIPIQIVIILSFLIKHNKNKNKAL